MMQPAQSILRKNPPGGSGANSVVRGSLPQPKMRAVLVVVADVFREQTFQMAFIHGNDVIQLSFAKTPADQLRCCNIVTRMILAGDPPFPVGQSPSGIVLND